VKPCPLCVEAAPEGWTHRDDSSADCRAHAFERTMPDGVRLGLRVSLDSVGHLYTWYLVLREGACSGGAARGVSGGCWEAEARYARWVAREAARARRAVVLAAAELVPLKPYSYPF
jgi:hypothetical protein